MQHSLYSHIHLFFFNKFATVCLGNCFSNTSADARIFLNQPQCSVSNQACRFDSGMARNCAQLPFLLGSEVDVHCFLA